MAYTNVGQQQGFPGVNEAGSLDVNAQLDPSARRFLLLFPKYTSPVRQISIGGHKYDIKR
jgi:hypothetical protein